MLGDGNDEWLIVLCSKCDRAYLALFGHRTVTEDADVEQVIRKLAKESNDILFNPEGMIERLKQRTSKS